MSDEDNRSLQERAADAVSNGAVGVGGMLFTEDGRQNLQRAAEVGGLGVGGMLFTEEGRQNLQRAAEAVGSGLADIIPEEAAEIMRPSAPAGQEQPSQGRPR